MAFGVHNVDHIVIGRDIVADLGCYSIFMAIESHNFIVEGLMAEFKRDIEGLEAYKKKLYEELKFQILSINIR